MISKGIQTNRRMNGTKSHQKMDDVKASRKQVSQYDSIDNITTGYPREIDTIRILRVREPCGNTK